MRDAKIVSLDVIDVRFPTSDEADGSDATFLNLFTTLGLQHVTEPTFITSGNTLDIILTNERDRIIEVKTLPPFPHCGRPYGNGQRAGVVGGIRVAARGVERGENKIRILTVRGRRGCGGNRGPQRVQP